jgi:DNA-binding NtrC family response regulator
MGGRVLLALGAGGDEVAAALRDGGFEVERCGAARLSRAAAEGGATLVVLAWGGATPAWAHSSGAPAWIALCEDEHDCAQALGAGAEAALTSPALLALHARRVAARSAAELEQRRAAELRAAEDAWVLLGPSAAARRLEEGLARVASTPRTTVLVRGQPGAPLDELARLVHARSTRAAGPLIELDAAGAPAERWDEVFGCAGGSLIVREVTRLDAAGQAALVQHLEPRAGSGDGGLRLIATSSGDLSAEVEAGRLREDLAYRLNVLTLAVPALAERREDLAHLAAHLAARAARQLGRPPRRVEAGLRAELARRPWPGDLLELSIYMTARELLGPTSLPLPAAPAGVSEAVPGPSFGTPESLPVADRSLRALEEALIRRVLEETGGNKLRAAEILGIHRTTLYHKLAAFGLDPAERL